MAVETLSRGEIQDLLNRAAAEADAPVDGASVVAAPAVPGAALAQGLDVRPPARAEMASGMSVETRTPTGSCLALKLLAPE